MVESLLQNGTLAIQVNKFDTGSGVRKVDVYQLAGTLHAYLAISYVSTCSTTLRLRDSVPPMHGQSSQE